MSTPLIKICGMRDAENIQSLLSLKPDLIGLIFVEKSPRYVGAEFVLPEALAGEGHLRAVGVFQDSPVEEVIRQVSRLNLYAVQLHGSESTEYCQALKGALSELVLIKAIPTPWKGGVVTPELYEFSVDYLLFDTASASGGGSGESFEWSVLNEYVGPLPFLIAGGVGNDNIAEILERFKDTPLFAGVDANSRLEDGPGIKNIELVRKFVGFVRTPRN